MAFSIETALGYLGRAREAERLAHAYLFCAPDLSEAKELAARLIEMVNGGGGGDLGAMESELVRFVQPVSKSRRITVKQIRDFEGPLHMAAPRGKVKVGVIVEADRMGREASNAFLKTLEEPPAGSLLLLLTSHPEQLLETTLSRCIRVNLFSSDTGGKRDEGQGELLRTVGEFLLEDGGGLSGVLGFADQFASLLKGEKAAIGSRHEKLLKREIEMYKQRTEGDWLAKREDYYKALTESNYVGRRNELVEMLLLVFGDALRRQNGDGRLDLPELDRETRGLAERHTAVNLRERFEAIEDLRSGLETSANEKLAMEVAFLKAFG
jgi:DNA polymerase-3 subunit delta'